MTQATDLLNFWFKQPFSSTVELVPQTFWFQKNLEFDQIFKNKFASYYEEITHTNITDLAQTAETALAECIILDQYPRNSFRDTATAFANDNKAVLCAEKTIRQQFDQTLPIIACSFIYLPFEHSEKYVLQQRCQDLFQALLQRCLLQQPHLKETCQTYIEYAQKHADIIKRFGRFPHRNSALGRPSTKEEQHFLTQPGSSF